MPRSMTFRHSYEPHHSHKTEKKACHPMPPGQARSYALVSINIVKKDSQLLHAGQGKGTGTETNDRYVSSNVLLLQRIRKDEQKVNMYRRVGIGKADGKHTGFWDNIERSTILLV